MALTDTAVKTAKPHEKPYKRFDTGGLYLEVRPTGARWWRFRYRYGGKDKLLSLGVYPEVSLKQARRRRDEARRLVADGIDPSQKRKADKTAGTDSFKAVAEEWQGKHKRRWAVSNAERIARVLERDVYPWLGNRPVSGLKAADILPVLRRIEGRGAVETAHKARQFCSMVMRYAISAGRAERDPCADLRGALTPVATKHHAAITDPKEAGALLRAIDEYQGYYVTKCALKFAPLVFVRAGELQRAEWSEIDLNRAEWNIPAHKMKMKEPHLVPLSRQAVDILRELHALTGQGRYVFPNARGGGKPMSENALLVALRNMGYTKEQMTPHGFRAMARTIMDEVLNVRVDLIEHQLAHAVKDPLGRAYNRTKHLPERRKMMQQWADYLDGLKSGATVVPFRRPA